MKAVTSMPETVRLLLGSTLLCAATFVTAGTVDPASMTTLTPGAPAVAAEVNGNFSEQTTQIDDNSNRITVIEQGRVIRQIDVQTDTVSRNFTNTWALGATFNTINDFRAGSLVRLSYHVPMRNDSQSWGGGYIEPQISFDGGGTWVSLGSSGYDGGVMNVNSAAIGSYSNTLLINPGQVQDFSVTVRFYHKSYESTLIVNGSHDINGISGTAPLMPGVDGTQHFTRVIVEELH